MANGVELTRGSAEELAEMLRWWRNEVRGAPTRRQPQNAPQRVGQVGGEAKFCIVREFPGGPNGLATWAWIERAKRAEDFATSMLYVGRGPRVGAVAADSPYQGPGEPEKWLMGWEKRPLLGHWDAEDARLVPWVGPTTRETELAILIRIDGTPHVMAQHRYQTRELDGNAPTGHCGPRSGTNG